MGQVVELADWRTPVEDAPADEDTPERWLSGPAKCLACKHEWVAVTEAGEPSFDLVCPKCDTRRGQLVYPAMPGEGKLRWVHNCGGSAFALVPVKKKDGYICNTEDLPTLNTGGRTFADYELMCHGCGGSITLEDLWC